MIAELTGVPVDPVPNPRKEDDENERQFQFRGQHT